MFISSKIIYLYVQKDKVEQTKLIKNGWESKFSDVSTLIHINQ